MKKTTSRPLAAVFVLTLLGMFGLGVQAAQDDLPSPYVISARAGTLNLAEDGTEVRREEDNEWEYINARKRLHSGDSLRTTGYARAEMLLNPGSYLRLANDAEIELTDAALDRLHVTVRQGAVIFEVTGTEGTDVIIRVTTPDGAFYILKPGIYRVQVTPNGPTEIRIRKGQIELGDSRGTRIKGRKRVYLDSANEPGYGDLARNDTDEFDNWSEGRSRRISDANARLTNRETEELIEGYRAYGTTGFGYAPNFGLWIYNNWLGAYTFFPFFDDWFSPYGSGYSACYRLPWGAYRPLGGNNSLTPPTGSLAKPPAPVFFPRNPGNYNPGYSTAPNPGGYNNGPVNAPKPSGSQAPAANDYRNGPAPRARDKAPGTVPSYTPPSSNTRSGSSSGGSNSGSSSGAQGGSRNTGGDSMSKPAPAPQAPARPAPAPQAPTKGGGKSPNND